eukprot:c25535_g1_i1.p1 GENE.c25535_g1_i1~~c25535_g1_i1.p1  ORF type:complete len:325 (-),score=64.33 c25535_g1_i1:19-969(-)
MADSTSPSVEEARAEALEIVSGWPATSEHYHNKLKNRLNRTQATEKGKLVEFVIFLKKWEIPEVFSSPIKEKQPKNPKRKQKPNLKETSSSVIATIKKNILNQKDIDDIEKLLITFPTDDIIDFSDATKLTVFHTDLVKTEKAASRMALQTQYKRGMMYYKHSETLQHGQSSQMYWINNFGIDFSTMNRYRRLYIFCTSYPALLHCELAMTSLLFFENEIRDWITNDQDFQWIHNAPSRAFCVSMPLLEGTTPQSLSMFVGESIEPDPNIMPMDEEPYLSEEDSEGMLKYEEDIGEVLKYDPMDNEPIAGSISSRE